MGFKTLYQKQMGNVTEATFVYLSISNYWGQFFVMMK